MLQYQRTCFSSAAAELARHGLMPCRRAESLSWFPVVAVALLMENVLQGWPGFLHGWLCIRTSAAVALVVCFCAGPL